MGLVLLDMTFRVERAFKVRVPKCWHEKLGISWERGGSDATLVQYHDFVLRLCREQNIAALEESWQLLVGIVEAVSGIDVSEITPDTRIIRDIGPTG